MVGNSGRGRGRGKVRERERERVRKKVWLGLQERRGVGAAKV